MCGRKTLTKGKLEIIEQLSIQQWDDSPPFQISYNVAPTHFHPVLLLENGRRVKMMRWGLIPSWAENDASLPIMINARLETLTQKPSFAQLVNHNRCLIITDGYYEWKKSGSQKQPYYIHHPNGDLLLMAGLWSSWQPKVADQASSQPALLTYTVITTNATPDLCSIHPRMPAFVSLEDIDRWLYPQNDFHGVRNLLVGKRPNLVAYPVTHIVNSVRNNSPDCVLPIEDKGNQANLNFQA